jgi:DNA-binding GntR family transcriptional regulator
MIPLDPLPSLTDQVYARMLDAITDRTVPLGHRIWQNEIAEKLGVSREPVSHALRSVAPAGAIQQARP